LRRRGDAAIVAPMPASRPPLRNTRFEILLDEQRAKHAEALIKAPIGDSHKHAKIVGHIGGLDEARELFRQATKAQQDQDDD
jgi:hypothetical protein